MVQERKEQSVCLCVCVLTVWGDGGWRLRKKSRAYSGWCWWRTPVILGVFRAPSTGPLPQMPVIIPSFGAFPEGYWSSGEWGAGGHPEAQQPQLLPGIFLAASLWCAAVTTSPSMNCHEAFSLGAFFSCTLYTNMYRWMKKHACYNVHFNFVRKI